MYFSIKLKKKLNKMFFNLCQLSSLLYSFPMFFLLWNEKNYGLSFLFFLLTVFAFVNHCREYTPKPKYDWIDITDRVLIFTICSYFIYFYYDFILIWLSLIYMLFTYFWVIPKCCLKKRSKMLIHSSFHAVTSMTALFILFYSLD